MFKEKIEQIFKKKQEITKEDKKRFIEMGKDFLAKKELYIAREYFRKGELKEKEIKKLIGDPEKNMPERTSEKEEEKKVPAELDSEHKEKLSKLGVKSIERDPYFAGLCLKGAGYSEEQVKPLLELAKNAKPKEEEGKRSVELDEDSKLRLKDLGLTSLAKNQADFAKLCFLATKLPEEEVNSLLELNLLGIDKEQEKIKNELEKLKSEK